MNLDEQLSVKLLFVFIFFEKVYLVKIGLVFGGSQLSFVTWYHKIQSVCSLGFKNVLFFT